MGIFPILMNIIQFWLIDSIVKASESSTVVPSGDPRNSEDREPLFGAPDDEGDSPPHDIENPRTRSNSPDETKFSTPKDDYKSAPSTSGASTPRTISEGGTSIVMHAYPPSSITSGSGSLLREGSLLPASGSSHEFKKTIPAPLRLQSAHQPAINSPDLSVRLRPTPKSLRNVSRAESLAKSQPVSTPVDNGQTKEWAASWNDSDDTRVGEDGWRMGQEILRDAWGPGLTHSLHYQQSAVGS